MDPEFTLPYHLSLVFCAGDAWPTRGISNIEFLCERRSAPENDVNSQISLKTVSFTVVRSAMICLGSDLYIYNYVSSRIRVNVIKQSSGKNKINKLKKRDIVICFTVVIPLIFQCVSIYELCKYGTLNSRNKRLK